MPTLAFLFTDIEDSTAKWESDYRAMSRLLQQHDRLLGEAVAAAGGRIVKHTGDGIFAALPPRKGLVCAIDIQRRIGQAHWGAFKGFRVRIGVHTGDAQERDGDYFGPVINCAARVMGKALGGQILASHEALTAASLPPGAQASEAGVFRLKGLERPQRLHHILHPDLERRELQAIRSDEVAHCQLPPARGPLLGREADLAAAEALFLSQEGGVLTLVGDPGTGKSAFALELGRRLQSRFADGAASVDLSQEDSRDGLGRPVGQAFGLNPMQGQDLDDGVYAYLAEKQLLLVLDPFDHLASRALFVQRLLERAPGVRVLATSTWRLGLKGETAWTLPPLSREAGSGADLVLGGELARQGLSLEPAAARELIELCEANALSLRLMVALLAEQSADQALGALRALKQKGLPAPPLGIGTALASAFECSWRSLKEPQQQVLARLAVFKPGFTAEAAKAVAGLEPALQALLLKRGLLSQEAERLSLGEPLRRLARVKMEAEAGARFKAAIAHRDHYLGFLRDNSAGLSGGDNKTALIHQLDLDLSNVREAWRRACETEALDLIASAAAPLGQYLDFRNYNREGAYLYALAIERFEGQGRSRGLAELYVQRANSLAYFGKPDESRHLLGLALDYFKSVDAPLMQAIVLTHQANLAGYTGDFHSQVRLAVEAQACWQGIEDLKGRAWSTGQEALGRLRLGQLSRARDLGEAALSFYEQAADLAGQLWIMGVVAEVAFVQGDIAAARSLCYRILEQARPMQTGWALASAYMQLATIAELQSSYREARHFLERAKEQFATLGRENQMAFNLRNLLAQVHLALGQYPEAQALLSENLDPTRAPEATQDLGWPMNLLAQLRILQGDFESAQELCEQGIADGRLHVDGGSWFKENLAACHLALGRTPEALELLSASCRFAEETGRLRGAAWGHNRLGVAELVLGRHAEARVHLLRARELHAQLGEPQGLASDDLALARLERHHGDAAKAAALAEQVVQAYISFAMPRGIALANLELGSCFLAQGDRNLAREALALALRHSADCGAWPVFYRALFRLAELRAQEGLEPLAVKVLACCLQQKACEADIKQAARSRMSALMKLLGAKAFADARDEGKALKGLEAAALLGVPVPEADLNRREP